jgi:glycerophosphoryl diester phosphodiesterase
VEQLREPLAIAHRAGNSLAGLRMANELGVDVIECDVRRGRGREQLEVRHLKSAGPLPFLWDRWELVPASAPRLGLHEVLAAQERGTRFMLDLKGGRRSDMAGTLARLLHRGAEQQEVLACGRQWAVIDALADLPYVRRILSARNRVELARLRRRLAHPQRGALAEYGVSVHRSLLHRAVVAELHRSVEVVMTWPVNDMVALDAVLALGVTGVISDEVDVLAALIARRGHDGA